MSVMFDHCTDVFEEMHRQSTRVGNEDIYEGHLTQLFKKVGLSQPYYSTITGLLVNMGCIDQLRRGGGGAKSQWKVIQRPTTALWDTNRENGPGTRVAKRARDIAQLTQQVKDQNARIASLEEKVEALLSAYQRKAS